MFLSRLRFFLLMPAHLLYISCKRLSFSVFSLAQPLFEEEFMRFPPPLPPRDFPYIFALFLSRPVNIGYPLISLWKYFLSLLIITWHSTTVLLSQSRQPRRKVRFRYFVVVFRPGVQCCDPCD